MPTKDEMFDAAEAVREALDRAVLSVEKVQGPYAGPTQANIAEAREALEPLLDRDE